VTLTVSWRRPSESSHNRVVTLWLLCS